MCPNCWTIDGNGSAFSFLETLRMLSGPAPTNELAEQIGISPRRIWAIGAQLEAEGRVLRIKAPAPSGQWMTFWDLVPTKRTDSARDRIASTP